MQLALMGDVMIGRLVNDVLKTRPAAHVWGDVLPLFDAADFCVANLECVLSDGGSPAHKAFTFRSDAKNVSVLTKAGVDAVSLANNHTLDYGPEALADTLGLLEQAGIAHAGAGRDITAAQALATVKACGMHVGLLAVTDTEELDWAAERARPGVWRVPTDLEDANTRELVAAVEAARRTVDLLVVSLHWGSNWGTRPEAGQRAFARALVDSGVDLVYGHSPHVFRGVEVYNNRPILYSTGDFLDDYAVDLEEHNDESFLFLVTTSGARISSVTLYPTVIKECQVHRATDAHALSIAARMQHLSYELGTDAVWDGEHTCLTVAIA